MKTLQEIKDEVTAAITSLTVIQADIQALQDAATPPAPMVDEKVLVVKSDGTQIEFVPVIG